VDPISGRIESRTQFDVFETSNPCIEPPDVLKRTLSDRAQTSPKGKRFGLSTLVDVVVA
jgi:hypothetical protein